jgi:hypothetical protein
MHMTHNLMFLLVALDLTNNRIPLQSSLAKAFLGASWIDAVCERKHQIVAGSGRGSPLRQLARRSRNLTLVHE